MCQDAGGMQKWPVYAIWTSEHGIVRERKAMSAFAASKHTSELIAIGRRQALHRSPRLKPNLTRWVEGRSRCNAARCSSSAAQAEFQHRNWDIPSDDDGEGIVKLTDC